METSHLAVRLVGVGMVLGWSLIGATDARADECAEQAIYGLAAGSGESAVTGYANFPATSAFSGMLGGYFECPNPPDQIAGVVGGTDESSAYGVYGESPGVAIYGNATGEGGTGVQGTGYGYGVYGSSTSSSGFGGYFSAPGNGTLFESGAVYGYATDTGGTGVLGTGSGYGVVGYTTVSTATAVYGNNASSGFGVSGASDGGYAVYGQDTGGGNGVTGLSNDGGNGVYGYATGEDAFGVWGYSNGNYSDGVVGTCSGSPCNAGAFFGPVLIDNGDLTVSNGCITVDSGTPIGTCYSDARLKKNVAPLVGSLDTITKLRPVTYEWIDSARGTGTKTGFVAQDVEQVRPEWVTEGEDGYKKINIDRLPVLLVDSVRTLKDENDDLRSKLETDQARIATLEGRLDALEKALTVGHP